MEKYLHIVQNAVPGIKAEHLDIEIGQAGIDSLDIVAIRANMEKFFGVEIGEKTWFQFKTLSEALFYSESNSTLFLNSEVEVKPLISERSYEIRMPQMALSALSENWLLKEMGDMHWDLLSKGLRKKSSEFKDDSNNRLYATFVRINYAISPLNNFNENELLLLKSEITRFGSNVYFTNIQGSCGEKRVNANLVTSFTQRQDNDNSKILKGEPQAKVNSIMQLNYMPELFDQYKLLKKELLEELSHEGIQFSLDSRAMAISTYDLNPYYDINGVGLLYFASYPIIADECTADCLRDLKSIYNFETGYCTIYRDVFYFANCNLFDQVNFVLNSVNSIGNGQLAIAASLFRASDHILMARIVTVKQGL